MATALRLGKEKSKPPLEAKNCKECIFYMSIAKWCARHKIPIPDPERKNCTAKDLFELKTKALVEPITI